MRTEKPPGWQRDRDDWLRRRARAGETTAKLFPDQTQGFVEGGWVYTRTVEMAGKVDRGEPVTIRDAR